FYLLRLTHCVRGLTLKYIVCAGKNRIRALTLSPQSTNAVQLNEFQLEMELVGRCLACDKLERETIIWLTDTYISVARQGVSCSSSFFSFFFLPSVSFCCLSFDFIAY